MRKIIVSEFVTLDGVMETPEKWAFPFFNPELEKSKLDEMRAANALLLGTATYQIFANSWPSRTGELADRMNGAAKYVVSHTPHKLAWNNSRLIQGDVVTEIATLKQESGQDILVAGSGILVQTLVQHDLVDEYRLLVYPLVLGQGKRLFNADATAELKLTEAKTFDTGVVLLRYEPEKS